jgi:hypothetical protein
MGRKQKLKKENMGKMHNAPRPSRQKSSAGLSWLIGIIVFVSLVIAGMVLFVQANKARFIKMSVQSTTEKLVKDLYQKQANFTRYDTTRMRSLLHKVDSMSKTKEPLDVALGGHLMFILKVMEEVLQDGKLKTGELDKMEMLIREAQRLNPVKKLPASE